MQQILFPIAIEPGDDQHAFGVIVPDLPGCFSAGDTLDEAYANAREAIASHLQILKEEGMPVPARRPVAEHQANPDYVQFQWGTVQVRRLGVKKPGDVPG